MTASTVANGAGRIAAYDGLDLEAAGVTLAKGRPQLNAYLRASGNPDVLFAGDAHAEALSSLRSLPTTAGLPGATSSAPPSSRPTIARSRASSSRCRRRRRSAPAKRPPIAFDRAMTGFEAVTVVRRGYVDHFDSLGASGRYGNCDGQWMTAGGGIQHAEMSPLVDATGQNPLDLFQIWRNLPRTDKMVAPHYGMFVKATPDTAPELIGVNVDLSEQPDLEQEFDGDATPVGARKDVNVATTLLGTFWSAVAASGTGDEVLVALCLNYAVEAATFFGAP